MFTLTRKSGKHPGIQSSFCDTLTWLTQLCSSPTHHWLQVLHSTFSDQGLRTEPFRPAPPKWRLWSVWVVVFFFCVAVRSDGEVSEPERKQKSRLPESDSRVDLGWSNYISLRWQPITIHIRMGMIWCTHKDHSMYTVNIDLILIYINVGHESWGSPELPQPRRISTGL